jgi:cation diffusion facilitator family transporter
MTVFLLGEATKRFYIPNMVNSNLMLPISIMGLFFNLIQMKILHQEEPMTLQDDIPDRLENSSQAAKIKDGTVKVSLLDN